MGADVRAKIFLLTAIGHLDSENGLLFKNGGGGGIIRGAAIILGFAVTRLTTWILITV